MFIPDFDKSKLIDRLNYAMTKGDVLQLIEAFSNLGVLPTELLDLTEHPDQTVGFRSAWVLENMLLSNLKALDYYLPVVIEHFICSGSSSVRRHLGKITAIGIRRIIKRQTSRVFDKEFWQLNLEPLEEVCFEWLVDESTKPAIKAHCMEILYLLSKRQRWIANELPFIIESQMEIGSPALKAKGSAVLKLIRTQRGK